MLLVSSLIHPESGLRLEIVVISHARLQRTPCLVSEEINSLAKIFLPLQQRTLQWYLIHPISQSTYKVARNTESRTCGLVSKKKWESCYLRVRMMTPWIGQCNQYTRGYREPEWKTRWTASWTTFGTVSILDKLGSHVSQFLSTPQGVRSMMWYSRVLPPNKWSTHSNLRIRLLGWQFALLIQANSQDKSLRTVPVSTWTNGSRLNGSTVPSNNPSVERTGTSV